MVRVFLAYGGHAYDIEADAAEIRDLSDSRGDLIEKAVAILCGLTAENRVLPAKHGMLVE